MTSEAVAISLLNGLSYGLLLFMLSAGLTLIFSLMGVLNFAHTSFYMLGAYIGYSLAALTNFWLALLLAPLLVGLLGAAFERTALRRTHRFGHVPELLVTFGLSYVLVELVQLVWGRVGLDFKPPPLLQQPAFTLIHSSLDGWAATWGAAPAAMCKAADATVRLACTPFPGTRAFMMVTALAMLLMLWLVVTRTRIGLVIQASLTHPEMVEALGHNVPRIFMLVFAMGSALAGLAGVVGGSTFVTEPGMAAAVGPIIFVVVVVGGLGSLAGAFIASILIGLLQTFAVAIDQSLAGLAGGVGWAIGPQTPGWAILKLKVSQVAPILPYLLLVLMLIFRPSGLLGKREA
jgi:branched-chain amino acid transport system permease protein